MTPAVGDRSHVRGPTRPVGPRAPRRVNGPAGAVRPTPSRGGATTHIRVSPPTRAAAPVGAPSSTHTPPAALRLAHRVATLPDARALDRLLRGRLWIALLAAGLVGVVFLQISLLKLNTGIARAVQTTQTLERQNTALALELSRLSGGDRIQESAAAMGFIFPATGQPGFLDARKASPARAAARITAPAPIDQLPLGLIAPSQGGTAGLSLEAPTAAPAEAPTAATQPAAPADPAEAPAAGTQPPAAAATGQG